MSGIDRLFRWRPSSSTRWMAFLIRPTQYFVQVFIEFGRDNGPIRASGLAYTSLLALVPLMAITFSLFTGFAAFQDMRDGIQEQLFSYFIPAKSEVILGYINQFAGNTKTLGFAGTIALLITSIMLFQNIEKSLNGVWKIRSRRKFLPKLLLFTSVLVWGTLLVGASFYVTGKVRSLMAFEHLMKIDFFSRAILWLSPFFLSIAVFVLLMALVPATKVRWQSALVGGGIGGVLWEAAKRAFAHYATETVSYSVIYGSLALIPLFLVWLYLTWMIVIFATEATYVHQNFAALLRRRRRGDLRGRERLLLGLRIYLMISMRFLRGEKPVRASEIEKRFRIPLHLGREILEELMEGGLLLSVEDPPGGYLPSKTLEELSMDRVLRVLLGSATESFDEEDSTLALAEGVVGRFEAAGFEAVGTENLSELLKSG